MATSDKGKKPVKENKPVEEMKPVEEKKTGKPRNVKNVIPLATQEVAVYASPKVSQALSEVTEDMTLYNGVRLSQVLEAVYVQGQKDGARNAILNIQEKLSDTIEAIPHRNPGKPKKPKK